MFGSSRSVIANNTKYSCGLTPVGCPRKKNEILGVLKVEQPSIFKKAL